MTRKISAFGSLTGANADATADYLPIIDASVADASKNKKIIIDELGIALLAAKHAARVSRVTNVSPGTGDQLIAFTTEDYDTDSIFTIGTSDTRLVIPSGWSAVEVKGYCRLSAAATAFLNIRKNGSALDSASGWGELGGGSTQALMIVSDTYLPVTGSDYLELNVFTSGAKTITQAWFSVRRTG